MHTFYSTRPLLNRHPVQVTIRREETLHRISFHKESEVFFFFFFFFFLSTATYIRISRLQCHRREIDHSPLTQEVVLAENDGRCMGLYFLQKIIIFVGSDVF